MSCLQFNGCPPMQDKWWMERSFRIFDSTYTPPGLLLGMKNQNSH